MKSLPFVIAIVTLFTGAAEAKDTTTFRVDSYIPVRFTDFQLRIAGSANLSGRNDDLLRDSRPDGWIDEWRENQSDDQQIEFWSDLGYQYTTVPTIYRYSLSTQVWGRHSKITDRSINGGYGSYPMITQERERTVNDWRLDLRPGFSMTRYIMGDWYISPGIAGGFGYSRFSDESKLSTHMFDSLIQPLYSTQSRDKASGYTVNGGALAQFELGFGRVYSGDFAFAALSIIGELRSGGYLVREPTYSEMRGLCDTILEYRQRHAVDSRYRRIAALTSILKYLRSGGVTGSDDPMLPFIISDVWDFFPIKGRRFGHQAGVGCELDYSTTYSRQRRDHSRDPERSYSSYTDQSTHSGRVTVFARLGYDRPLSLRWQFVLSSRVWYVANSYVTDESRAPGLIEDVWGHESRAGLVYFHDARTSASIGFLMSRNAQLYGGYASYDREDQVQLNTNVWYRVSVPTTISANFAMVWTSTDGNGLMIDERDHHDYRLGVSIVHWLY
jgi:hypothetical protein